MRWRFSKLNWSYGLGELAIVVAGVLIALAIDQWNQDRVGRIEEESFVDRLIVDVRTDIENFEFGLRIIDVKEESLTRLRATLSIAGANPINKDQTLEDIVAGANYGWRQRAPQRTTYDELLGSGKFGLIRDARLRDNINRYYDLYRESWARIDERETPFPDLSFQLIPTKYSESEIDPLFDRVVDSPIPDYVIAELNLAWFIRSMIETMQPQSLELLADLEAYADLLGG